MGLLWVFSDDQNYWMNQNICPSDGTTWKVKGSPELCKFILREMWMSVPNVIAIQSIVLEIFKSGPKLWSDGPTSPPIKCSACLNSEMSIYGNILSNMNCLPPCSLHADSIVHTFPHAASILLYLYTVPLHPLSIRLLSRLPQLRKISISNYISSSLWDYSILGEDYHSVGLQSLAQSLWSIRGYPQSTSSGYLTSSSDCKWQVICGFGTIWTNGNTALFCLNLTSQSNWRLVYSSDTGGNPLHLRGILFCWLHKKSAIFARL